MLKLAVVIFLYALARSSCDQGDGDQKMDVFRLPDTTKPDSYELKFTPNFDGFNSTFNGEAKINITVIKSTNVITLNLKDLNVTDVRITDISSSRLRDIPVIELKNIIKNEQIEIYVKTIPADRKFEVRILYNGKIRNDMSGLYMSSYQESNTTKLVTNFKIYIVKYYLKLFTKFKFKLYEIISSLQMDGCNSV